LKCNLIARYFGNTFETKGMAKPHPRIKKIRAVSLVAILIMSLVASCVVLDATGNEPIGTATAQEGGSWEVTANYTGISGPVDEITRSDGRLLWEMKQM